MKQTLSYPLPKKDLVRRYKEAFSSLLRGNSTTLIGFPDSCGYAHLKFIFSQPDLLNQLFSQKAQQTHRFLFLDFDSLPELSTVNFHKHLLHQIVTVVTTSESASHPKIKPLLTAAKEAIAIADPYLMFQHTINILTAVFSVTPLRLTIVINDYILDHWDEAWGRNFYRIWTIHRTHPDNRLSFLFITKPYLTVDELPAFIKPLRIAYFESVHPLPLFSEDETYYVLSRNEALYNITLPKTVKQYMWQCVGGYYQFYFALIDNINRFGLPKTIKEAEKAWFTDAKIIEHVEKLYESLPLYLKSEITRLIEKGTPVPKKSLLHQLGVLPLPTIWSYYHKQYSTRKLPTPTTQSVVGNEILTKEPLTSAELSLLEYLVSHTNKLVTREDLAQAIWGESEDSYSDWAIDKLVSRVRNKIVSKTMLRPILTVKGKGYKFIT